MRSPLIAVALAAVALAAGCGDDDSDGGGNDDAGGGGGLYGGGGGGGGGGQGEDDGATRLSLAASPAGELAFDKTSLEAKPGPVVIAFANPSQLPHAVEVEGNGVEEVSDTVAQSTTTVSANLKPGEYRYYCNIPGHADAGMDGTLTVE